ncbi:hypothetical protein BO99DRAFT_476327 [Aspergillus violaceofuscus CBS 115571]|uniref:Uncharacterized protein n=1 Tax=Aspergillus violaceofuscus (strain CBS 115571) TaxID=1450538 RepID=A0A2V5H3J9_ASPV1|nr:hypothetical protein BO99DRAFT_476327 [Aspergillus violaceofuscus CBS 115571]
MLVNLSCQKATDRQLVLNPPPVTKKKKEIPSGREDDASFDEAEECCPSASERFGDDNNDPESAGDSEDRENSIICSGDDVVPLTVDDDSVQARLAWLLQDAMKSNPKLAISSPIPTSNVGWLAGSLVQCYRELWPHESLDEDTLVFGMAQSYDDTYPEEPVFTFDLKFNSESLDQWNRWWVPYNKEPLFPPSVAGDLGGAALSFDGYIPH